MKILSVTHFNSQQPVQYLYADADRAEVAYEAIKAAMNSYKPYGNDKDSTVTVSGEPGEMTFRLDHLTAVGIGDMEQEEATQIAYAHYVGRIRGAIKASEQANR